MQVAKWGNSLAIRIPADVARELSLKEGDEVTLHAMPDGGLALITEQQRRDQALTRLREIGQKYGDPPEDFKFDREWANSRDAE